MSALESQLNIHIHQPQTTEVEVVLCNKNFEVKLPLDTAASAMDFMVCSIPFMMLRRQNKFVTNKVNIHNHCSGSIAMTTLSGSESRCLVVEQQHMAPCELDDTSTSLQLKLDSGRRLHFPIEHCETSIDALFESDSDNRECAQNVTAEFLPDTRQLFWKGSNTDSFVKCVFDANRIADTICHFHSDALRRGLCMGKAEVMKNALPTILNVNVDEIVPCADTVSKLSEHRKQLQAIIDKNWTRSEAESGGVDFKKVVKMLHPKSTGKVLSWMQHLTELREDIVDSILSTPKCMDNVKTTRAYYRTLLSIDLGLQDVAKIVCGVKICRFLHGVNVFGLDMVKTSADSVTLPDDTYNFQRNVLKDIYSGSKKLQRQLDMNRRNSIDITCVKNLMIHTLFSSLTALIPCQPDFSMTSTLRTFYCDKTDAPIEVQTRTTCSDLMKTIIFFAKDNRILRTDTELKMIDAIHKQELDEQWSKQFLSPQMLEFFKLSVLHDQEANSAEAMLGFIDLNKVEFQQNCQSFTGFSTTSLFEQ